jgi:RNase P subunit RPR2
MEYGYMVSIVKYNTVLNDMLKELSCPKCHKNYNSEYWRHKLKYPKGKIILVNKNSVICDSCGFHYMLEISLDVDKIKE